MSTIHPNIMVTYLFTLFTALPLMAADFAPELRVEVGGQNPIYTSADFNGDGLDDFVIVVANKVSGYDVNFISGSSNAKFEFEKSFSLTLKTRHITTGDFNGDNLPDLAFSHYPASGTGPDTIAIYFSTGTGFNFAASHTNIPTDYTPVIKIFSTFDANNDGLDDLLVDEHVRLSAGDGRFYQDTAIDTNPIGLLNNRVWYNITYQTPILYLSDVNGDGTRDFILNKNKAFCGNGDGTFAPCNYNVINQTSANMTGWSTSLKNAFTSNTRILHAADFNGDGITDIASTVLIDTFTFTATIGQPDNLPCPIVQGQRPYRDADGDIHYRLGDIYDCTPQADITVTVRAPKSIGTQISLMNADGTVASQAISKMIDLDTAIIQANTTNRLVSSTANYGKNTPYFWTQYPAVNESNLYDHTGGFGYKVVDYSRYTPSQVKSTAIIVDANNDGMMDFLFDPLTTKQLELSLGDGTFIESMGPIAKTEGISGDFNGDGLLDIVYLSLPAQKDHTLQVQLQIATTPVDSAPVDPTPTPADPNTTATAQIEMVGVVTEAGTDYFIVNGTRITMDSTSIIKFNDGFGPTIMPGDPVDFKANVYSDGSVIAVKAQFGG